MKFAACLRLALFVAALACVTQTSAAAQNTAVFFPARGIASGDILNTANEGAQAGVQEAGFRAVAANAADLVPETLSDMSVLQAKYHADAVVTLSANLSGDIVTVLVKVGKLNSDHVDTFETHVHPTKLKARVQ